ncbi:MAG: hypothetical protein GXO19_05460 [Epsilonproteobacteria bacterium]|nr:hypothetical protein [Campylobacterota bacterium]NPA57164.1 hypothetical protein [Campylobacterota bacterium]
MKVAILFIALVVALFLFSIWKSNPAHINLKDGNIILKTRYCENRIPVKVAKREHEMVDEVEIERFLVELPNGDPIYYEIADLPPKDDFGKPYSDIVESLFGFRVREVFSHDGFVLYRGDFDIALFYKSRHDLILLYPADDLMEVFRACFQNGLQGELKKYSIPPKPARWSVKQIILEGLIEKDI